jgi:hypothetical protein
MDDDVTANENVSDEAKQAEGAQPSGERTYSVAEVENIVKERLARDRKSRRPESQDKTTDKKTSHKAESSDAWFLDFSDAMDAISDEMDIKVPLKLKQRMRAAFRTEAPDDPHAWVKGWLEDVGLSKTDKTTTPANDNALPDKKPDAKAKEPGKPPVYDKGPASGARDLDSIINPMDLTKADKDRLVAKLGEVEANKKIAAMALQWAKTARVSHK